MTKKNIFSLGVGDKPTEKVSFINDVICIHLFRSLVNLHYPWLLVTGWGYTRETFVSS